MGIEHQKTTDELLFKQYFHTYYEGLHRYAYTLLKDSDEAKDAVQQVFVQLWHKKEHINIVQSAKSYLYSAVHNYCLNVLRNEKTRQKHYSRYKETIGTPEDIQTGLDEKELKKEMLKAMEALPDKCRLIFYKSRFEEKKYAEIAAELNLSVKTIEVQMGKALKILRTVLSGSQLLALLVWYLNNEPKLF